MSTLNLSVEGHNRVYRRFLKLVKQKDKVGNPSDAVGDGVTSLALHLQGDAPSDCPSTGEQRAFNEGLVVGYLTAHEMLVDALDR